MTLQPDILTLVLPLVTGTADATRDLIRTRSDPGWIAEEQRWMLPREDDSAEGPDNGIRRGDLDLSGLPGLHCCAFIVLDPATKKHFLCNRTVELPAYLIFEATIDGASDAFIRDLVDHCAGHLAEVLKHCEGLPKNAVAQPDLLVDFLLRRKVTHNTYFSGVPGKSVSEIKTEDALRRFLTRAVQATFFPPTRPGRAPERPKARFSDIQRHLRNLVRKEPSLNLVEEQPSAPWSVRQGKNTMKLILCLLPVLLALPACWLLSWIGIGFEKVSLGIEAATHAALTDLGVTLGVLVLGWAILRGLRVCNTPEMRARENRAPHYLVDSWLKCGLSALRLAIAVIGLAIALDYAIADNLVNQLPFYWEWIAWAGILTAGLAVLLVTKALRAEPLRRLENGPFVTPGEHLTKAKLRALVDAAALVHQFWCLLLVVALTAMVNPILGLWNPDWPYSVLWVLTVLAIAGFYYLAGAIVLMAIKDSFLIFAHALQVWEGGKFGSADKLAEHNIKRDHIWAREEHRTHLNQNHFASATLVKSWPRMLYLRMSLLLVNLFARYWDNQGKLGGIPTIFSARWLLLDQGHRLVFMTNYVGAWDSYLGEFSDLNAYIGVNAIWTNTYLQLNDAQKKRLDTGEADVGFPESSLMLFRGACMEQPFKAYVRQSQIETLAWYGAYPRLSVPNIHDNARIRRDLFRDLSVDELDALFRRI